MSIEDQVDRLIRLGVADLARIRPEQLAEHAQDLPHEPGVTVAVHPSLVPASRLATLLERTNKPGFVVADMIDLDEFSPIAGIQIPARPIYAIHDADRGDDMRNASPNEALQAIAALDRTPLTIGEGISWLLQEPERLQPNLCFMTIASRKTRGDRLDARTPAIWISGGTGRDGVARKGAPKVGWCWAGNRHTWLGFASARHRSG